LRRMECKVGKPAIPFRKKGKGGTYNLVSKKERHSGLGGKVPERERKEQGKGLIKKSRGNASRLGRTHLTNHSGGEIRGD